jgi:hypothetical protein
VKRVCDQCRVRYDDAAQFTICPHQRFLSSEMQTQKDLAMTLLGKDLFWASDEQQHGEPMHVQAISFDGMVTVTAYTGEFAPHLFRVRR